MECTFIEMDKLDLGYDVFYISLTYEALVSRLVFTKLYNTSIFT